MKARLGPAELGRLARLDQLEVLVVRLEAGARLPDTLVELRALTLFGGTAPALPKLERLTAWAPATLPPRCPRLLELAWQPTDETLAAGLAAIRGYPALQKLVLFNAWPSVKKVPPALAKLRQLRVLRLVNTAWGADAAGLTALRRALEGCVVEVT